MRKTKAELEADLQAALKLGMRYADERDNARFKHATAAREAAEWKARFDKLLKTINRMSR